MRRTLTTGILSERPGLSSSGDERPSFSVGQETPKKRSGAEAANFAAANVQCIAYMVRSVEAAERAMRRVLHGAATSSALLSDLLAAIPHRFSLSVVASRTDLY